MKQNLNENLAILGLINQYNRTGGIPGSPIGQLRPTGPGPMRAFVTKYPLYDWQARIVSNLQQGNDVYVLAKPGAGKTLPMYVYWEKEVLGITDAVKDNVNLVIDKLNFILTRYMEIPKIALCVPIKQLADETFRGFIGNFGAVIISMLNKIINELPITDNRIQELLITLSRYGDGGLQRKIQELLNLRSINVDNRVAYSVMDELDKNLNSYILQALDGFIRNKLCTYATGEGIEGNRNFAEAPVIVGIYEKIEVSVLSKIKHNLKFLVFDECHFIQYDLQDIQRAENVSKAVYKMISSLSSNTRLLFMTGTVHPSAADSIINYVNVCFKRRVVKQDIINEPGAGNKSQITVVPDNSIRDIYVLSNILAKHTTRNALVIIFSRNKILKLAQLLLQKLGKFDLSQIESGLYGNSGYSKSTYGLTTSNRLTYPSQTLGHLGDYKIKLNPADQFQKDLSTPPGAEHLNDPFLKECVSAGFGYMFRKEEGDRFNVNGMEIKLNSAQIIKDAAIVANLFSSGKIRVILATDAVGIGVNLKVETMFLPSISKSDGKGGTNVLMKSNASQLFNRTGRADFNFSTIRTPEENVDFVREAIASSPEQFEKRITITHDACHPGLFSALWQKIYKKI